MKRTISFTLGLRYALTFSFVAIFTLTMGQDPGFFLDDWEGKTARIPASEPAEKPAGEPTVTILVDAGEVIGKIPKYIYGNNAVTWDNGLRSSTTAMTDLRNLDPHVLRWPGGNLSNSYFWNRSVGDRPEDIPEDVSPWYGMDTQNWQMSLDEYYALLEETGSTGIICVNYDYARYGTGPDPVATAAHLAAEWVRYDNGRSKFWEIGNENFGNWEPGYQIDVSQNQDGQPEFISGQLYGQHCRVFIDSMRAAAAEVGTTIKIGVVAYDAETSWDPIQTVWNEGMMPEVGDLADFLIVHSYFTPYDQDSPVSTILNSPPVAEEIMATMVSDMAEAGKPMIPVAFTEWNIFAVGSMQAVSYINGMHAALLLGQFMKDRYGLSARWDLVNGWSNGDDHGIFSSGGEPGVDPYNPRPAFFYMYYFQEFFGDRMIDNIVSGSEDVVAYSSSFSSGETGVVIINKSTSGEVVQVDLQNVTYGANYYYHTLTGGTDNGDFSRKVLINGIATDEQGGGPDEYASIKAYSSETDGGIRVSLPPLSVVYLMVDQKPPPSYLSSKVEETASQIEVEFSDDVQLTGDPSGFTVVFNQTDTIAVTGKSVDPGQPSVVILELASAIGATDEVTLSYNGTDVQSLTGVPINPFAAEQVNNLLAGSAPRVTDLFTTVDGEWLFMEMNKQMEVTAPSPDSFEIIVAGSDRTIGISAVEVIVPELTVLMLTPAETLYKDDSLLLAYSGSAFGSLDGGLLEPFELPVTNNGPAIAPEPVGAEVTDQGFAVALMFSKPMGNVSDFADLFTVQVNGAPYPIENIVTDEDSVIFHLGSYIRYLDTVIFSYDGTSVTSADGGILEPIDQIAVMNGLPEPHLFILPDTVDLEQFSINMGMELEACSDAGGGNNLGYIDPGDWVEYEVEAGESGFYAGSLRIASATATGQLILQTPDGDILNRDTLTTPVTGGWQQWTSVPVSVPLMEGRQRLRLYALTGNYNLNWLNLEYDRPMYPSVVNAATNSTGDTVKVFFDKTMTAPPGKNPSGHTLLADGVPLQVASISWSGAYPNALLLRLLTPLSSDHQEILLSYADGVLTDADGQPVPAFSGLVVENQVVTSLSAEETSELRIYPNPVGAFLNIDTEGLPSGEAIIRIVDVTGKTVFMKSFPDLNRQSPLRLETESWKEGLYLIRISIGYEMIHRTFIKR